MRSKTEIDKELEKLVTVPKYSKEKNIAVIVQALGWALGEDLSPSEMLNEEIENA